MEKPQDREPGLPGGGEPRPGAPPEEAEEAWFFGFRLLGARYAFEASHVIEVVRLGPLTRLPSAPGFLPGVFTHRGEVLAVLDLAQLMGREALPIRAGTRAAVVDCPPWKVAVVAEAVEGLFALSRSQLDSPPSEASGAAEFLSGVANDVRGPLAILDLPRMVAAARARSVAA
jgi:purine-binding chemotaxis protein CheW